MAGGEAMAFDLTHARHDPMHCLVPGLFRSLKRGERKKLKLDVTYHYAENEQARFVGFEPLGADDMRLLQGLVALGGPKGIILTSEPTADLPKQLRLFLEPKFDAVGQDALVVREHGQPTKRDRLDRWRRQYQGDQGVLAAHGKRDSSSHQREQATVFSLDELCLR